MYNPGRELAVDEAMIKFQGRSSLKQYLPKKPIKRGIKVWVLADSSNGYFSRLEVYTGKKGDRVEEGLGARVVPLTSLEEGMLSSLTTFLHPSGCYVTWRVLEYMDVVPADLIVSCSLISSRSQVL